MGNFDTTGITEEYTIYDRVAGNEEEPLSKWWSGRTPDGRRLYYTGRTIHIVAVTSVLNFIGMSKCKPTDAFDKKEGKRRARDRALGAYLRGISNAKKGKYGQRGLRPITIKTYKGKEIQGLELMELD